MIPNPFYISSSALTLWGKCPYLYKVTKMDCRESVKVKAGRDFGRIIHTVLAEYYKNPRVSWLDILTKEYENFSLDSENYRTLSYATDLIQEYLKVYKTDPFVIVCEHDKPIIERPLMVPLCDIECPELSQEPIHVVWTGIIDALVRYPDGTMEHLDHKTSSRGGQTFFDEYVNDIAQTGYTWALNKQGFPTTGFTINAIVCPKPTVKGITNWQFLRQRICIDEDQLVEWENNTKAIVNEMFMTFATKNFPLHRWNCVGRYGRCDLYELCSYNYRVRDEILQGSNFQETRKSPIYVE